MQTVMSRQGRQMLTINHADIRWMIRRDMAQVIALDQINDYSWPEVDFLDALRERDTIGMVFEKNDIILGYMIYRLEEKQITLVRLAVLEEIRRQGVGRALVEKMKTKLAAKRRGTLSVTVRERQLGVQLFLRACGLTCCLVEKGRFSKPDEDGYRMEFCVAN
jgi:ribosomal protein S18 acetylase RimI-like enzyme